MRRHGLAPLAYVRTVHETPELAAFWRADLEEAVGRHLRTRVVLKELSDLFGAAEVAWVVLKGPVLSEHAHPVSGVRPYVDLDLLVGPAQFEGAVRLLCDNDWTMLDRNHRHLLAQFPGEVHLLSPSGVQVDLHWSLINMSTTRSAFTIASGPLLARRRFVQVGSHGVPALCATDMLLHTCLHAALTGADRLLLLLDVHEQVHRSQPRWNDVAQRAHEWGAGPATATVLIRSSRTLGTPVQRSVLRQLAGLSWRAIVRAADRVSPVERLTGGGSLARIVARSSRPTTFRSFAELATRSRRHVLEPGPIESTATVTHDPQALRAYFERVARQED